VKVWRPQAGKGSKGGGRRDGQKGSGNLLSQLNSEIASRQTVREILAFFEEKGGQFDFVNLVTALHRVAKSSEGRSWKEDQRFRELLARVAAALRDDYVWKKPRHLSNTAWALSKLLIQDATLL